MENRNSFKVGKEFWKKFRQHHWKKNPGHFVKPFKKSILTNQEIDQIFIQSINSFDSRASQKNQFSFHVNGKQVNPKYLPQLISKKTTKLDQIIKRLKNEISDQAEVMFTLKNAQTLHQKLWLRTNSFINDFYRSIGIPSGGVILDIFSGTNRKSPFKIHKDGKDIFTFVLSDHRIFYLWPKSFFDHIPRSQKNNKRFGIIELQIDPQQYLDQAIRYHANQGDLIYWPSDYWHYVENESNILSSTLILGIYSTPWTIQHETEAYDLFIQANSKVDKTYTIKQVPTGIVADKITNLRQLTSNRKYLDLLKIRQLLWINLSFFPYGLEHSLNFSRLPAKIKMTKLPCMVELQNELRLDIGRLNRKEDYLSFGGIVFVSTIPTRIRNFFEKLKNIGSFYTPSIKSDKSGSISVFFLESTGKFTRQEISYENETHLLKILLWIGKKTESLKVKSTKHQNP